MGKKKKLKKKVEERLDLHEQAIVICVGKKCAPREASRALVDATRAYVAADPARAKVHVEVFGCLGICKKGPIAATLPKVKIYKRCDVETAQGLVDALTGSG